MLLDHRRPAVFLPADPPREGRLALYGEGPDEIALRLHHRPRRAGPTLVDLPDVAAG
jgi:hypothetical protein